MDLGIAILFVVLSAWSIHVADAAAAEAVRNYGYNIDSGALAWVTAFFYLAPTALLFGVAALCIWREWRIKWVVHWSAVTCALAPILAIGVIIASE